MMISQGGVARQVTKDHKVNNQSEIARIEKAGHSVEADIEYMEGNFVAISSVFKFGTVF